MDNTSVNSGTQGAHRNRAMVRETSTSPTSHSEAIFASRRFSLQQQRASLSTNDTNTPYILPLHGDQIGQARFPIGSKVYVLDSLTCATVQQCFIQMIPTVKLLYEVKTDDGDIQMLSQDSLRYVAQGNSEDSRTDMAVAGLPASRTAPHQRIVHTAASRPSGKTFPTLLKVSGKTITALKKKYSEKNKKLSRQKKLFSKLRGEAEYTRNIAKNLSESLECSICFNTMRNPYILPTCSHRFCGKCIKKSIRTNGKKCPMCREYACLKTIREDQFLREIISNALVIPTNEYRAAAKNTISSGGNDACCAGECCCPDPKVKALRKAVPDLPKLLGFWVIVLSGDETPNLMDLMASTEEQEVRPRSYSRNSALERACRVFGIAVSENIASEVDNAMREEVNVDHYVQNLIEDSTASNTE
ncbi:hypothetical protein CTEN210_18556 [Chaetoceros tenuissimus]|uniref:RING-type domain-containing protein n=1 Tax=Chaetoceros tenuissimus TaxID=426638 RepID=A0AAD3DFI3_9STRA|nr:hypothetical protein CTEN210_18556 [Chaetoceros tenuissimus]